MISKIFKNFLAIILIPFLFAIIKTFCFMISDINCYSKIFHLFERGALFYLIIHAVFFKPVYLYVLGHEFVHALATWVCGGKVISFKVLSTGGKVVTNKTNFFIDLSPYFIPIYTIFFGIIFLMLKMIDNKSFFTNDLFMFFIGMTLMFHFVMTSEAIKIEQPDIIKSGFLFSWIIIIAFNIMIIVLVFSLFSSDVSFFAFIKNTINSSKEMYLFVYDKIVYGLKVFKKIRVLRYLFA